MIILQIFIPTLKGKYSQSLPAMKGNMLKEITWLLCITQLIGGRTCLEPRLSDLSWSVFVITLTHIDNIVQFSCSVVSDSLRPHEPQPSRPPCPSPTPGVHPNPCPLSRWCHPTSSSSVVPFSCLQSFPASESFQWVSSLHQVARVLELQLQHQSFQWTPRTDFL